jgi:hypothetical protein
MPDAHELWLARQAIELLAQHIPFETDPAVKSECIEELRALALRSGRFIDATEFGFEARLELQRLNLWGRFANAAMQQDDDIAYGHGRRSHDDEDGET